MILYPQGSLSRCPHKHPQPCIQSGRGRACDTLRSHQHSLNQLTLIRVFLIFLMLSRGVLLILLFIILLRLLLALIIVGRLITAAFAVAGPVLPYSTRLMLSA